jgi:hypothetical protein
MWIFLSRLTNNFRSVVWVCFVILIFGGSTVAQETPAWSRAALRDSAVSLLYRYQSLHNQIDSKSDPLIEREFVHLFSNPKVQVIGEIGDNRKSARISLEEYITRIGERYPDGITVSLNIDGLSAGNPVYDRSNRYVMQVRLYRSLKGISGGKVIESSGKVVFSIAFVYNDKAENFTIYGIDHPEGVQGYLSAAFSPGLTGISNPGIRQDSRFGLINNYGFRTGIRHTLYLTRHAGLGYGVDFSGCHSTLTHDKIDPLGGFDPALRDLKIENRLWFWEFPVYGAMRFSTGKRFEIRANAGLTAGVRFFETMSSSAVNSNNGAVMHGVFSDAGWIEGLNRLTLGIQGDVELIYRMTARVGIIFGVGIYRGLTALDHIEMADYNTAKYTGQFNPLWAVPGNTVPHAFYANLGASWLMHGEKSK